MAELVKLFLVCVWIFGIVLAKGFWSTFFAVVIPFWSYYLVAEEVYFRYWI